MIALGRDFYGKLGYVDSIININSINRIEYMLWRNKGYMEASQKDSVSSNIRFSVSVRGQGVTALYVIKLLESKGLKGLQMIESNCSVVAIDHENEHIIMYRGPIGRYPLYWKHEQECISWSTNINVLRNDKVKLNPYYFSRFLVGMGFVDYWEETPYLGIYRIPRGKAIIFHGFSNPVPLFTDELKPFSSQKGLSKFDVHGMYRELIIQSVKKHRGKTALFQCSGGLDSTALIIANRLAKNKGDDAATYVWNEFKDCDESDVAEKIAKKVGIPWHTIPTDDLLPMSHIETMPTNHLPDEPSPDLCFYPWRLPMFKLASALGHESIISGYGADDLLSGNYSFISDQLRNFEFRSAWQQSLACAERNPDSGLKALWFLKSYGIYPLLRIQQKSRITGHWDPSIHNRFMVPGFLSNHLLGKELKNDMEKTLHSLKMNTEYKTQLARNMSTVFYLFHSVDGIGRNFNIDENYPYLDRPVIEFVLGIPHQYTVEGHERKVLTRRVFGPHMPKGFVAKQGNYYRLTFIALQQYWSEIYRMVVNSPLCDVGIISKEKAIEFLNKWRAGKEVESTQVMNALIGACIWLDKSDCSF